MRAHPRLCRIFAEERAHFAADALAEAEGLTPAEAAAMAGEPEWAGTDLPEADA